MPSVFDTAFATAFGAHLQTFGEPVTYTPETGDPVSVELAIWHDQPDNAVINEQGEVVKEAASVDISTDDVADPDRDATVTRTATSETWTIDSIRPKAGYHVLTLGRWIRRAAHHESYPQPLP